MANFFLKESDKVERIPVDVSYFCLDWKTHVKFSWLTLRNGVRRPGVELVLLSVIIYLQALALHATNTSHPLGTSSLLWVLSTCSAHIL
jgi:hypothetical protein